MNIDRIIPSVLHVVSSKNVDISKDLENNEEKSIAECIEKANNEKEKKDHKEKEKN
jgi:hypothetical protein